MSSARVLSAALRNGTFSEIRLVFEDHTDITDHGPLELVVPLTAPMCTGCQNLSKITLRRPFTFTSMPFPFDPTNYPCTREQWTEWAAGILDWFRDLTLEQKMDEWRWAVNLFWICYIGSTPRFPVVVNEEVHWCPDIVPIAGELMHKHSVTMAMDEYLSWEKIGAMLIGELVDWVALRTKWIAQGVDVDEYHRRIGAYEF